MREAAQSYHHLALTIALLLLLGAIAGSDHDCIVVRLSSHGNEMWNAIHSAGMEAAAECGATQMKRLLPKRRTQIEQDQRAVTVMARWLAGKHVRERYRAQGVKVDYIDPVELANATNSYLEEHRYRLRIEAELILFKICN